MVLNRLANVNAFELHYKDRLLINSFLNVMEVYFNFKADGEENLSYFKMKVKKCPRNQPVSLM